MLHEARDRQKFVSDVQYLRDMQHKVDSEYQACLKRQEYKKDPNEKTQDQLWGKDTSDRSRFSSGSSSKQTPEEGLSFLSVLWISETDLGCLISIKLLISSLIYDVHTVVI
ncbi:probable E3 ubiquitin-protein ligase MARCHF10 isoform X2 [Peromyscus eremicus]|uniref:probable E3 ubiquitin-protein ligase MARCHF10 isoform X2 n=1 Tax=Peromyscus eremicus TaxID=42410 RepID=UPI0027DE4CAA|nr:probable E3 ubiquitin-protein ligase MARCHF10 isoform X2 [Peromyscus eremicus]